MNTVKNLTCKQRTNLSGARFFLAVAFIFFTISSQQANAQLVSSLPINTGYENVTPGAITTGTQDPNWKITNLVSLSPPAGHTIVYNAFAVHTWSHVTPAPTTPANTQWISYDPDGMDENNGPVDANGDDEITFYREFTTCQQDNIRIEGYFRSDNRIVKVKIDGVDVGYSQSPVDNWSTPTFFTHDLTNLPAQVHTIEVTVENTAQAGSYRNAIGLNFDGDVISLTSSNSIVDLDNFPEYACQPQPGGCNDLCYWRVTGNSIFNNDNLLGTLTDDDIRIISNYTTVGQERGVIKNGDGITGGYLGWNTMNPTARLHVDCINGNEEASGLSDVRFENLETGEGYILVIDPQGYVFRTSVNINDIVGGGDGSTAQSNTNDKEYIKELERRIELLEAKLNMSSTDQINISAERVSTLDQNTPNPFSNETVISYNVTSMERDGYIAVYTLNGEQLNRYSIKKSGKGAVTIDGGSLPAGMYLYSLIIDGREIDTRRMVLTK